MNIFCIIPAYNEEKTIEEVINKVKPLVDKVVVVDDASTDKTYQLAKKHTITVLRHIINRGQGAALQTGNEYAINKGADIIVHFDADGQFLAQDLKDIIAPIKFGEADIVFGSRFLEKKSNMPWFKRYVIMPLAKLVNNLTIKAPLTDPQNGFRALAANASKKIIIEQDGMAHCTEIIMKALRYKLKIKEVPVTIIYHSFGQKFSGGIKIIKDLIISKLLN
ncbi:MAG: glycosyltransferase family 2 protein [Patescibacteria group bacterium]